MSDRNLRALRIAALALLFPDVTLFFAGLGLAGIGSWWCLPALAAFAVGVAAAVRIAVVVDEEAAAPSWRRRT